MSPDSNDRYAATPTEPVRVAAVMSTLMPHLAGRRLYVYRDVIVLALLGSLIAAAFGLLSVALVFAAVALPAALLTYIQDQGVWKGDPITSIGLGLLVSMALGVGVGLLQHYFATSAVLSAPSRRLPSVMTILELGVLLPVVTFVALLVTPVIVTQRPRMRNAVDTVVICTLSGAALSLGLSVVIQIGAFTHVTYGDPAHVAFIALNLGVIQPVIYAAAAAVTVLALRRAGANTAVGLATGLVLVLVYQLGTTLLTPYGTRGVVLTTVLGVVVAAAGLLMARAEMHTALLAEATGEGESTLNTETGVTGDDRMGAAVVAAIVVVIVLIAAGITGAVVLSRDTAPPEPPKPGPGGQLVPVAAAPAGFGAPVLRNPGELPPGMSQVMLASHEQVLAVEAEAVELAGGIAVTPAEGWTVGDQGEGVVVIDKDDGTASMFIVVGVVESTDTEAVLLADIEGFTGEFGFENVKITKTEVKPVDSKNFQEAAMCGFTADIETQQGSLSVIGMFLELMNTSDGMAAFVMFLAQDEKAFDAAADDADSMIGSML